MSKHTLYYIAHFDNRKPWLYQINKKQKIMNRKIKKSINKKFFLIYCKKQKVSKVR